MKMTMKWLGIFLFCSVMLQAQTPKKAAAQKPKAKATTAATPQAGPKLADGIYTEIETPKGKMLLELYYQKTPVTVANFIALAEGTHPYVSENLKGKKFFDGLTFHRVIKDFMIQGGDPAGNGSGGPGYAFKDEITEDKFTGPGILAMANAGPKTNGSQFFITHKETPWLNGKHTIFGKIITGQDVVNAIAQNDPMTKVTIIRKGAAAKAFDAVKVFSDYYGAIAMEEQKAEAARKAANEAALKEFMDKGQVTASGLRYIVIQEGTGEKPLATSNVKVHYTGMLTDGKIFDSSVQRGQPIDFGLNQVIKGWTEGVQLMPEGSKYKFYIPYQLAYGDRGAGGVIPPKADLIFEVELLKINSK
ncbi:MAG: peptidylprolyl isomerase [Flavobacterium stagni]